MKKIIASIALIFMFTGCVGLVTGHEYTQDDFTIMYQVVKDGVVTFMTPEQIKRAKLDKVDLVVTKTYKLVEKNAVGTK